MTKKEFLAISLPYGLKIVEFDEEGKPMKYTEDLHPSRFNSFCENNYYRPVLRPMKEISTTPVRGEEDPALYKIWCLHETQLEYTQFEKIFLKQGVEDYEYWIIKLLVMWNFDIAGLISKNEAVNYRDLPWFSF